MSDSDNVERRTNPRVSFEDDHSVSIFTEMATPVDLSTTGVMLEVSRPLRGVVARLRLDLGVDRQFNVEGRVVRHFVNRFELCEDGTTIVKYRVAIEFIDLDERASEIIQS